MKSTCAKTHLVGLLFGLVCIAAAQANTTATHDQIVPKPSESAAKAIPFDQISATAEKQYAGDGLSVAAATEGATLRCVFQRMEGRATAEGLWLHSTSDGATGEPFRVKAVAVGRQAVEKTSNSQLSIANVKLVAAGAVEVAGKQVRYVRPGLVEEYSVSMDGVRQDFVVAERPAGEGQLCVALAVDGAKAVQLAQGARLILDDGGRTIAYYRLQVADAAGKGLPAKLQVLQNARLAVSVDDAEAVYPVRIDPTFSDENWISVGGLPGADGRVHAAVVDGLGNLYIGGDFANVGNAAANRIAKWDGTTWSALGLGMDNTVHALAAVGNELYAGGHFQSAGDIAANYIAKWDGSHWSALGSGMDRAVFALVASGGDLYAGGSFTNAGGVTANCVAKWNGNNWTGLGAGIGGYYPVVLALAVSGHNLYAGGYFWTAGGSEAKHVAKWDGSTWSALGSGTGGSYPSVHALAVLGEDLFVGGEFTTAGGHAIGGIAKWNATTGWSALTASIVKVYALAVVGIDLYAGGAFWSVDGVFATRYIAKWNGSSWSALGNGMEGAVLALASSGGDLYAGGEFYTSDRTLPKYIAKWDGNTWSAPGAGLSGSVQALAVSGSDLYVGGYFSTVGSLPASGIARWNGSGWSALGTNPPIYSVTALAVSGDVLFAAMVNFFRRSSGWR